MIEEIKIIQIMAMPNDQCWQGHVLGLGSDGVVYINSHDRGDESWHVYMPLVFSIKET